MNGSTEAVGCRPLTRGVQITAAGGGYRPEPRRARAHPTPEALNGHPVETVPAGNPLLGKQSHSFQP